MLTAGSIIVPGTIKISVKYNVYTIGAGVGIRAVRRRMLEGRVVQNVHGRVPLKVRRRGRTRRRGCVPTGRSMSDVAVIGHRCMSTAGRINALNNNGRFVRLRDSSRN